jgi:hypothetical protein
MNQKALNQKLIDLDAIWKLKYMTIQSRVTSLSRILPSILHLYLLHGCYIRCYCRVVEYDAVFENKKLYDTFNRAFNARWKTLEKKIVVQSQKSDLLQKIRLISINRKIIPLKLQNNPYRIPKIEKPQITQKI